MTYTKAALGHVIAKHRSEQMTQEQLGQAAGYGQGAGVAVSRIESGLAAPSALKLAGIAKALGIEVKDLKAEAAEWDREHPDAGERPESAKDRARKLLKDLEMRQMRAQKTVDAFNKAHDAARDQFFVPFVVAASQIADAPQASDPGQLADDSSAKESAEYKFRVAQHGTVQTITSGVLAGAASAKAGTGLASAAYATFAGAAAFSAGSTGAAKSGLPGLTAANAKTALLGGGTLAAGGAGIAGATTLLATVAFLPAAIFAVAGILGSVRRSWKKEREKEEQIEELEVEVKRTQPSFDSAMRFLQSATGILEYLAVHGGHAAQRWESSIALPSGWSNLTDQQRRSYEGFLTLAAIQLSVVGVNVSALMEARGDELKSISAIADELVRQARETIEAIV